MDQDDRKAADEIARADDEQPDTEACGPGDEGEDRDPDSFELELDGQTHTLPAALKGAFLRQADYTRKTQELAEHRRALEAERAAVAEQARAHEGASHDRMRLAALDHQLAELQGVDWRGFAQQDPQQARALWSKVQGLAQARDHLASAVAHHEHGRKLQAAREAAEAMAETGRTLAKEIEGWSPELAGKLTDYARGHGVTLEELQNRLRPPGLEDPAQGLCGRPGGPARQRRPGAGGSAGGVGGGLGGRRRRGARRAGHQGMDAAPGRPGVEGAVMAGQSIGYNPFLGPPPVDPGDPRAVMNQAVQTSLAQPRAASALAPRPSVFAGRGPLLSLEDHAALAKAPKLPPEWWNLPAKYDAAAQIKDEVLRDYPGWNDAGDARRHAELSRRLDSEIDPLTAMAAGYAHEIENTIPGSWQRFAPPALREHARQNWHGQPPSEAMMDLRNNVEGRRAAEQGRSVDPRGLQVSPDAAPPAGAAYTWK
ncbi:MAG: hypothetical protein JWP49_2005 [Phenylobacterium sp.]|nr:hypothetical protein [Phenylobacterium sp.]